MPFQAPKALLGLYALGAILFTLSNAAASPTPPPKVFGFDFKKQMPRNAPSVNRLQRRQKIVTADISNEQIAYIINITIGTPPQLFSLQLDTGSSDLWVPSVDSDACSQDLQFCQTYGGYDITKSSTAEPVGEQGAFQISYEDNSGVMGNYFTDILTIGNTVVKNLTMGVAEQASRPAGIMGIGYIADESIASQDPSSEYPNVVSQLKDQGYISSLAYSLWLNDPESQTGSILFGGLDTAKFHGNMVVLPVQPSSNTSSGNSSYTDFTVALSAVSFTDASGKTSFSQTNLALPVILDSGTTITYLPDDILNPILAGVGAVNNAEVGGPIASCASSCSSSTFNFGFGGNGGPSISLSLNDLLTPLTDDNGNQVTLQNGEPICSFGLASSGTGPILFGDSFLQSAYVVYDLTNNQIGMAQTNFNASGTNVVEISGSSIPSATVTASGAAVTQTYEGHPQETRQATKKGGAQATDGVPSPTFDLGACVTSTAGKSGGNGKSAARAVVPPRLEAMTVITGFVCLASLVFGGSMVFFI